MERESVFDVEATIALGDELKVILTAERVSLARLAGLLCSEGFVVADKSRISRFLRGEHYPSGHLVQAIARNALIKRSYPLPNDYNGGSLTDYFLDRISGRITEKSAGFADKKYPDSREDIKAVSGGTVVAKKEAIALMRKIAAGRTAQQLAELVDISPEDLQEILDGREPDTWEYIELGELFPDRSSMALWQAHNSRQNS